MLYRPGHQICTGGREGCKTEADGRIDTVRKRSADVDRADPQGIARCERVYDPESPEDLTKRREDREDREHQGSTLHIQALRSHLAESAEHPFHIIHLHHSKKSFIKCDVYGKSRHKNVILIKKVA